MNTISNEPQAKLCGEHFLQVRSAGTPGYVKRGDVAPTMLGMTQVVGPEGCERCHPRGAAMGAPAAPTTAAPSLMGVVAARLLGEPDPPGSAEHAAQARAAAHAEIERRARVMSEVADKLESGRNGEGVLVLAEHDTGDLTAAEGDATRREPQPNIHGVLVMP